MGSARDVMRKTIVYYRNSPSILFWERESPVTTERLAQMVAIRKELDPHGMRVMGIAETRITT